MPSFCIFFASCRYCLDMLSSLFVVNYLLYEVVLLICSVNIAELSLITSNSKYRQLYNRMMYLPMYSKMEI